MRLNLSVLNRNLKFALSNSQLKYNRRDRDWHVVPALQWGTAYMELFVSFAFLISVEELYNVADHL
jgi:hypothetical protein